MKYIHDSATRQSCNAAEALLPSTSLQEIRKGPAGFRVFTGRAQARKE